MSEGAVIDEVATESLPLTDLDLGYQVSIDAFSGPLDLLLYLVRRAQVDIADIPVAGIADQFVATLASWERMDLDVAGDFILMAATLLEIKSRMVAPPRDQDDDAGDDDDGIDLDPRSGLIQQLLTYRRFKDAVGELELAEADAVRGLRRVLREQIPEDADEIDALSLDNADPYALYQSFEVIQARISGLGPRTVVYDDMPMEARMATVAQTVQAHQRMTLRDLLSPLPHRVQQAGLLIAVLECTRQRIVKVDQLEQFGPVTVTYRAEDDRAIATETLAEDSGPSEVRRRRRPPLVTWHEAGPVEDSDGQQDEGEAAVETDEQRFLRELEAECALEAVLARGQDLEASFHQFVSEQAETERRAAEAAALLAAAEPIVAAAAPPKPRRRPAKAGQAAVPSPGPDDGGPRFTWVAADGEDEGFFDPDPDDQTPA